MAGHNKTLPIGTKIVKMPKGVWASGPGTANPANRAKEHLDPLVKALAKKYTTDAILALVQILQSGPPAARVAAAGLLLDRGWGKPKQEVEMDATVRNSDREGVRVALQDFTLEQLRTIVTMADKVAGL